MLNLKRPGGDSDKDQKSPSLPTGRYRSWIWIALLFLVVFLGFRWCITENLGQGDQITYTEFLQRVRDDRVTSVTFEGKSLRGELRPEEGDATAEEAATDEGDGPDEGDATEPGEAEGQGTTRFNTHLPEIEDEELLALLEEHGVEIAAEPAEGGGWGLALLMWLPLLLLGLLGFWAMRRMRGGPGGGAQLFSVGKSRAKLFDRSQETTNYEDVAGVEGPKAELREVVEYLKDAKKFEKVGAKPTKGVLLVGPPGTGKTLLARATAGEAEVPFYSISGSDFMELFVGVGASRVRDLFTQARQTAPSIVFIDELDSIGRQRGAGLGGGHDEREQTLNQLLSELDGFEAHGGVVVLAATNRPDILDPALQRPGRFDRKIVIDLPGIEARRKILEVHRRERPLDEEVDLAEIARGTPGFSGADLENLLNEAALLSARRGRQTITQEDIEDARDKIMLGLEREGLVLTEGDRRLLAYHEAGHAVLAAALPHADPVSKVSIIPRGQSMGATQTLPARERYVLERDYLMDRLTVMMGGRAAEGLFLGTMTNGAAQDLKEVTRLVRKMVTEWGMSEQLGPVVLSDQGDQVFLGQELGHPRQYSEGTAETVDVEIKELANLALNRAEKSLHTHRVWLESVVELLLEEEEISGDMVVQIGEDIKGENTGDALDYSRQKETGIREPVAR